MISSLYLHNIARITLKPTRSLPGVDSLARDILIEDVDGRRFEITLFGTESGLGLIEESEPCAV